MKPKITRAGAMADSYAELLAKQAEVAKEIKALKEKMRKTGKLEFEGAYTRVTISVQTGRMAFDSKKAEEMLKAVDLVPPYKSIADSVRFNVTARVADKAVA